MTYKNNDHKKNFNDKKKPFIQQPLGNKVIVIDGNFDFALRKFKKKVQNSGLLDDIRKKEFFDKPTNVRKVKKAMAVKREQKRHSLELRPSRGPGNQRK
jgi:small subunit ribosomal protein S21